MAKYEVSIMCSSKQRANAEAKLIRADGYGARVARNTGRDSAEYPYLVKRTDIKGISNFD